MLGDLPWWVTAVILAREIGVTVLRFAVLRHGVIPASRGGKLKTLVQGWRSGCSCCRCTRGGPWLTAAWVIMWAAVALTVLTGVDYVVSRRSSGFPVNVTRWSLRTPRALVADLTVRRQSVATAESLDRRTACPPRIAGVPGRVRCCAAG